MKNSLGPAPLNMRVQRTRSSASPPHLPLTRCPLGRPMWQLILIPCLILTACSTSGSPIIIQKAWHESPSASPAESQLYFLVEWSAVQRIKVGMTESQCRAVLGVPVVFWEADTFVFSLDPKGVEYEIAFRTGGRGGIVQDISYKRRAV